MRDLLINDARPQTPITYTARAGAIVTIDGAPAIVMRDGQVQRQIEDGTVDVLDFDRYAVQLGGNFEEPDNFFLKALRPQRSTTCSSRTSPPTTISATST